MTLGEKLLQARLEAGLTQKELCAGVITRNMLSQIEHGTAKPSMDTLRHLAFRLGKPVSYFLDENTIISPNHQVIRDARAAFDCGNYEAVLDILEDYRSPDVVFDRERETMMTFSMFAAAEDAIREKRYPYAKELLERIRQFHGPFSPMERRRQLLLLHIPGSDANLLCSTLPQFEEEVLLRAEAELRQNNSRRALELLAAAEDKTAARWNLLQGKALFAQQHYGAAAEHLRLAEGSFPRECWPMLEVCCREQKDFEQAYRYACKQKEK